MKLFDVGENKRIAVKIVGDRDKGIESLKIINLE